MWTYASQYKLAYFYVIGAVILSETANIVVPLYYKKFFDLLAGTQTLTADERTSGLVGAIVAVLIFHAIGWLLWRSMGVVHNWLQPSVMADIVQSAHASLHRHSYAFFLDNFAGSLVRKVGRIERAYEELTDQLQFRYIPLAIMITGNLVVLYLRHYLLAVILLVWMVVFIAFNIWFSMWKMKYDAKRVEIDSEATGVLADSIANAVTIKLFTGFGHERSLYQEVTERLRRMQMLTWNLGEITDAMQAGLMFVIEFALMYTAIHFWQRGMLTIGDFALIQGYLVGMFGKLWDLGRAIRKTYESIADASEMVEIMEASPDIVDARGAKPLSFQGGGITFQNVYFSFNKTRRVLKGLNVAIEPGQKVALVGPSGAGKTTITKLLLRFYDIERGKILIGNQNIAKVTQESLRAAIAVVPQEPILFHRTIRENIRYGRPGATDEEVIEAAKKARCHEFILELQDGYNTYVGERGVKLSGGERQRVAIARAILKDAPILVLDEATSSLDSESEQLIQQALHELMCDKTAIVIAHRLSTIMEMDRILVIDDGRVVDDGTHSQLIRHKGGIYKNLWEIQAGGFVN
ncbi:ABC transporter ATP-binding protein [Candidatus Uhrbacteria bacterium]|nr:ABC transporter ATP-binding protein [Candidatus Uhrbacteria bacterium]